MPDFSLHGEKDKIEDKEQGKGTNFIRFTLSKASKYMHEPLTPLCITALAVHLSEVCFTYSDNKNYEICSQMRYLTGPSGIGKHNFPPLVKAIMRDMRNLDKIITSL